MDMSTPIDSLHDNNNTHDQNPDIVNSVLDKYNNMNISPNAGYEGDLPPINPNIPIMEHDMENRNMNAQLENMRYMNPVEHIEAQKYYQQQQMMNNYQDNGDGDDDEDDEDDYEDEVEKTPLWKKIANESRIIIFILIMVLFLFNNHFDKLVSQFIPYFRLNNYSYDMNVLGTFIKAFFVGLISYILIRFIRF
jgi:hypothetical protein